MGGQSMAMTAKTNRTVSSGKSKLSYTIYADINDADQAAEHLSATKQRKVDMLYEFDEEAQYVLDLIYEDKDKTFGFEVQKKKKKKSALFSKFSEIVNDLLLPPEMRPQWEKEQAALKREKEEEARLKKLKAERDWKRAGGLKDDVEEEFDQPALQEPRRLPRRPRACGFCARRVGMVQRQPASERKEELVRDRILVAALHVVLVLAQLPADSASTTLVQPRAVGRVVKDLDAAAEVAAVRRELEGAEPRKPPP